MPILVEVKFYLERVSYLDILEDSGLQVLRLWGPTIGTFENSNSEILDLPSPKGSKTRVHGGGGHIYIYIYVYIYIYIYLPMYPLPCSPVRVTGLRDTAREAPEKLSDLQWLIHEKVHRLGNDAL